MCDTHFTLQDYLPVVCKCIACNVFHLRMSVSFHIFLVNRPQTKTVAISADTELPTASNPIAKAVAAAKCLGIGWCRHDSSLVLLPWYCSHSLLCCQMSVSGAAPSAYVTTLASRFQNNSTIVFMWGCYFEKLVPTLLLEDWSDFFRWKATYLAEPETYMSQHTN